MIDYSAALLSKGGLSKPLNPYADLSIPGEVTFNWSDNSAEGNANASDKAMVLVYNPLKKDSVFILDGAERMFGSQTIYIPSTYSGEDVELFMAFVAQNGKVSNSVYLGSGTAA